MTASVLAGLRPFAPATRSARLEPSQFLLSLSALAAVPLLFVACGGAPPATTPGKPVSAVATPAGVAMPPPRDDGRLPSDVVPTGYQVELTVDPAQPTFSGRVRIGVHVTKPGRAVVLHGRNLRITSATVVVAGRPEPATASFRQAARSKGEADELVLTTQADVPQGPATLDLSYEATFSPGLNGLYRVEDGGRYYAFTQFEPHGARLAFPCFDEPAAKVPFEMAITAPEGTLALSNMPETRRTPSADGARVTFAFQKSPPMPTYLVALSVGPLEVREGSGGSVPIRLATVQGRSKLGDLALATAREQLAVLEGYFGTKYPYPKLDLLAVPNFASGAMENAGLVTFREERLLLDEKTAPTNLRRALYGVIAHELAHMWFGDLVTMQWWDDIWLNEGFATWMATRVLDTWRPEMESGVDALGGTAHALHVDTLGTARKVRQPVRSTTEALEAFDGITYVKGAALLNMIERWLGREVFRAGVVDYLARHAWGNATGKDLFDALGRASKKDVASVLASFTEQTGVPRVVVDACRVDQGKPTLRLTQREHRPLGGAAGAEKSWRFPVCVRFPSKGEGGQACTLLEGPSTDLVIPEPGCPAWIYPNADQAGYYHARAQSPAELAALPSGTLAPRERVGLLLDVWALVEAGEMEAGDFLAVTERFRGDPTPAAWERIASALELLNDEVVSTDRKPALAAFARRLLGRDAARLGWEPTPKEGDKERMRRRLVLFALGSVGKDEAVLAKARAIADRWLTDPTQVDGDQAAVALPLAARSGNAAFFDRVVGRLKAAAVPTERVHAVTALGAFSDPALIRRAVDLVVDGTIRAQDQIYVFSGFFNRAETRAVALEAVTERLDAILERIPPFARRRIVPILARSCSSEGADRARTLFEPRLAALEGADRGFQQALEQSRRCSALRDRHRQPLGVWLAARSAADAQRPR